MNFVRTQLTNATRTRSASTRSSMATKPDRSSNQASRKVFFTDDPLGSVGSHASRRRKSSFARATGDRSGGPLRDTGGLKQDGGLRLRQHRGGVAQPLRRVAEPLD